MRDRARSTEGRTRHGGFLAGALVALGLIGAGPAQRPEVRRAEQVALALNPQDTARSRRFEHVRHERVSCLSCHGSGAAHRTILMRTPRDCAACHHDARQPASCDVCHAAATLPASRSVAASMRLSPAREARRRELSFRHEVHLAAGAQLTCRDCHTAAMTLGVERDCASCHTSHHTARADCSACHAPAAPGVHGVAAHLSCAGSGCHTATAPPPTLSRAVCVACHPAQRTHEREGVCADCHRVPTRGRESRAPRSVEPAR